MDDFKASLEKQMKKAAASAAVPKASNQPVLIHNEMAGNAVQTSKLESSAANEPEDHSALAAKIEKDVPKPENAQTHRGERAGGSNLNRVTVNLFAADRRALAVIKEYLGTTGNDFTSRSDSIKVALRFASKAKPEELARLYEQVKAEDRRFRTQG